MAQFLTVVNRTKRILEGVWDGRHYDIAPGKNSFPEIMALKFRDQNPIMGTLNPYTGMMKYLIGVEELHDDCSPIEQSTKVEQFDREEIGGPPVEIHRAAGIPFANERHNPLTKEGSPVDTSFSDPNV